MGEVMTTKEKIIRKSIEEINAELSSINEILEATPLSDIIELRKEAQKLIKDDNWKTKEVQDKIDFLAEKEKKLFSIAEKQKGMNGLIDRKVKLASELSDLNSELYYIDWRKKKQT